MDAEQVLRAAYEAVVAAEIPDSLQEVAFVRAIELISGGDSELHLPDAEAMGPAAAETGEAGRALATDGADRLSKIAATLRLSRDQIEQVYVEYEDELQVVLDADALGKSVKERAVNVALLLAAGRQYGGWDASTTPYNVLRSEVERHHVLDSGNFAKQVKAEKAWFNVNGSGAKATFGLKPGAKATVRELIETHLA